MRFETNRKQNERKRGIGVTRIDKREVAFEYRAVVVLEACKIRELHIARHCEPIAFRLYSGSPCGVAQQCQTRQLRVVGGDFGSLGGNRTRDSFPGVGLARHVAPPLSQSEEIDVCHDRL